MKYSIMFSGDGRKKWNCDVKIPIFTAQLEKSRDATDAANVRAAIAQATADYL